MTGLKLNACFWYLDSLLCKDVLATLKEGKFDVQHTDYQEREKISKRLAEDPPDLVISDFDLPHHQRVMIEEEMEAYMPEIPLIYLVGEKNARKAADTLKTGVWDYVQKEQLYKLVPSVYSSQKYANGIRKRKEAEQALSESRDRYMSIFKSVHDGILLFDSETRKLSDYNPRVLEMFGFTDEDMGSLDLKPFSAADEGYTVDRAREYLKEAAAGEPVTFEWKNVNKTGEKFWTLNSISIVQIDNRPYILLVTRNIDQQKKLESSLTESREHFRALAENSPDVIMHFDRNHRHLYVNSAVEGQTGLSMDMFIDKSHREMGIFPEELVALWEEGLNEVFKTGKSKTLVFDIELGENKTTFEWRLYPETGTSEAVDSVIGVARDITDSMKSEDALRRSEERLNLALAGTNLGLWDWNLVNDEVYLSPIWLSMIGYGPEELPQKLETWTSLQHPDDLKKSYKIIQEAIKNREDSFDTEFRLKHKNGSYVWIRSQGKAVSFDAAGNTTRLTGIHENINERKKEDLVRQVLFEISNAVNSTHSLDELYGIIRESLGRVVDTTNCFLALYNEESDTLTLPFMEDEKDAFTEFPARKTMTSFVIRTGEAQLVDVERENELTRQGEIELVGAPCVSWLGVPLKHEDKTIGVFAVQSYSEQIIYTQSDAEILEFASEQIAMAIDRRRHQDRLRSNQERQRRVFESSPDPMIVVDPTALILDFNSAFLEAFNVDAKLVYGQKIFRFINQVHWRSSIQNFSKTWEKGYLKNLEYQVVRPDGVTFDAEVSTGAIYDSEGKPESMVLILKNISDRKEAERKILEAKYKAEESDRLKTGPAY